MIKKLLNRKCKFIKIIWNLKKKKSFSYVYKMSNEARKHTQIRKITAEKYSENKIHTLCVF